MTLYIACPLNSNSQEDNNYSDIETKMDEENVDNESDNQKDDEESIMEDEENDMESMKTIEYVETNESGVEIDYQSLYWSAKKRKSQ